ncbi:unnamed protein product [Rotaria magnacalcarata]|uniref:Uncharacterized protein n=1 Tax=Rotaria magnacalcarata TaxID=392030 RepID=A0A815K2P1_9BILA|nr:unnamed protein product [Rotaria magnacalcarata]CAF1681148.1 unnamed protein product [Rotaria magnacalcarata]
MEHITGCIVDLTDEKQGPVKFYKRFTIITTEQEKISGWIFSSTSFHETTIENTLTEVIKKQTAVTIKGKITTEADKHDQPINIAKLHGKFPSNAIVNVSIQDDLTPEDLSRITIKILHENSTVYYEQDDKNHKYKTFIVGNESSTNILIIYDQLIDIVELNKDYTFTNIKTKKNYNTLILSTTSNTTVSKTQNVSDGIKLTFWTVKGLLKNFIQQQRADEQMNKEDISEILLLQGPWKMTLSVFRRQALALAKN